MYRNDLNEKEKNSFGNIIYILRLSVIFQDITKTTTKCIYQGKKGKQKSIYFNRNP